MGGGGVGTAWFLGLLGGRPADAATEAAHGGPSGLRANEDAALLDTTARIAAENPGVDYLGIEVHGPGIGALLRRLEEKGYLAVGCNGHVTKPIKKAKLFETIDEYTGSAAL